MAIKLKTLNGSPAHFPISIEAKNLAGEDVEITFTAIGRTLREWQPIYLKRLTEQANEAAAEAEKAELKEKAEQEAANEASAAEKPKKGKADAGAGKKREPMVYNADEIAANIETALLRGAALVREVAVGWELDAEFTDQTITDLIAQFPGVQQALHQRYNEAILGHRVKNS